MTGPSGVEPEPIDAEFEPAEGTPAPMSRAQSRRAAPRRMRSRSVTWPHLITASAIAAVFGATVAIIVSNASSNAPTGTLAREIDELRLALEGLQRRSDQASVDIVGMRSRIDAHGDRLRQKDVADTSFRTDLAALASQLSAVAGAGGGAAPDGAAPNTTPLGILLSRINRLERIAADATASPDTTEDVRRAIADLSSQVAELDLANTTLVTAFDQREAALAALETGLHEVAAELAGQPRRTPIGEPRISLAATALVPDTITTATTRAQTIRALSVLEAAAREGGPFSAEHAALADLLPGDEALSSIANLTTSGVPALPKLRADFDVSASRALRHTEEDSDDGWNWLRQSFSGVVAFEPAKTVSLNAETLRTARRQLDVGEIRDAVTAVSGLSGRARADFETWREKALQRALLDDAMKSLNTRLLGAAAATPGPG
jgi:hypothetical protein